MLGAALVLLWATAAMAGVVTGICTNGSYGNLNAIYQWQIGVAVDGSDSKALGVVDLDDGTIFNYNIGAADVAVLSDSRIAVLHNDATGARAVSVFTPQYGGGNLTGLTKDATIPAVVANSYIAPLPGGGFATTGSSSGTDSVIYEPTGPNAWTGTVVAVATGRHPHDVAGLTDETSHQFAVQQYDRYPHRYDASGHLAKHDGGKTYFNGNMEGSCSALLVNGWVSMGCDDWGTLHPTYVFDSDPATQTDGGTYTTAVGRITESDGSDISAARPMASLADGRVVILWGGGWNQNSVHFRPYTLVLNPANQPVGSIGANGEDFDVEISGNFVGRLAGDYMYEAPPAPIAEPAGLGLLLLGLPALFRRRRRRMGKVLGLVLLGLVALTPAAMANVISGLGTNSSYGQYHHVYQWRVEGNTVTRLGTVDLQAMFNNEDRGFRDIAMLSDRRVAAIHQNSAGDTWQTSVLTMQYDGAGLLTGATVDATVDNVHTPSRIGPLPNGGFVTIRGGEGVVWEMTAPDTWSSTTVTGMSSHNWDVAGLINPAGDQFVTGQYATPPGGTAARSGHKYDKTGKLASYYNSDMGSLQAWGYGGKDHGEGLRHELFQNGWVTEGYSGNNYGTYVYDGTQTDGAWHDGLKGELTASDGSPIYDKPPAALDDGRVVLFASSGWNRWENWYLFTLESDPAGQPAGSVGATGWDQLVEFNFPNRGGADAAFVGVIAGDYMYEPPAGPIAEPAGLGLVGLALLATRKRRRRA
jgi:hypothetical protein